MAETDCIGAKVMKFCLMLALYAAATLATCQESLYNVTRAELECVQGLAEYNQTFAASCPAGTLDTYLNVSLMRIS